MPIVAALLAALVVITSRLGKPKRSATTTDFPAPLGAKLIVWASLAFWMMLLFLALHVSHIYWLAALFALGPAYTIWRWPETISIDELQIFRFAWCHPRLSIRWHEIESFSVSRDVYVLRGRSGAAIRISIYQVGADELVAEIVRHTGSNAQDRRGTLRKALAYEAVSISDFDILTTTRAWVAYPWDYNSSIYLRFRADGFGDMVFARCQIVGAVIDFKFLLQTPNELTLIYQASPGDCYVKPFIPNESGNSKAIHYSLKEGAITGVTANTGPFEFCWTLSLDESPFPDEVQWIGLGAAQFPREYYGHNVNEATTRPGG